MCMVRDVHDAALRNDKNTFKKLQQKIADSFFAKALAVKQAAIITFTCFDEKAHRLRRQS